MLSTEYLLVTQFAEFICDHTIAGSQELYRSDLINTSYTSTEVLQESYKCDRKMNSNYI